MTLYGLVDSYQFLGKELCLSSREKSIAWPKVLYIPEGSILQPSTIFCSLNKTGILLSL
jgi:hypothetical protein